MKGEGGDKAGPIDSYKYATDLQSSKICSKLYALTLLLNTTRKNAAPSFRKEYHSQYNSEVFVRDLRRLFQSRQIANAIHAGTTL